ncbi:L-seryl-tRNA(Sec) selenium transferase [Thiobacter aerophilum]|uniref:L-seryl-tRNA(Sec) selenium transferase n=1 Tax=Thiobacter aerophilum TaxID=3121275 RepID=A0ABV0EFM2_9BURK
MQIVSPAALPAVDKVLAFAGVQALAVSHGRKPTLQAVRTVLGRLRACALEGSLPADALQEAALTGAVAAVLKAADRPALRAVFNLTGTVLHTNLGRALLPEEAIARVAEVMRRPCNLEFDLAFARRGDRDSLVEPLLQELTGAEAAAVVNNNAAAVLLALDTLARGREVIVSRGELIEIGGSFRIPDIMRRAGCKLLEVGTTNRTHRHDYADAIGAKTALLLKVHTSNYVIQGFTASVDEPTLATLAHEAGLPFMVDLGSGTLVDLSRYGLPYEPTPQQALAAGADLVSFSGDKLLGGPQAGILVGRKELIARIKKNPLKRALRVDKLTYAALEAVLRLYRDPDRLPARLPTLRLLTLAPEEIEQRVQAVAPTLANTLAAHASVTPIRLASQIGSGSLPVERLESRGLRIEPLGGARGRGRRLAALEAAFRHLPTPVIGRIADDALLFDLRCLEREAVPAFLDQLTHLSLP